VGRWATYVHSREIRVQINAMIEEGRIQLQKDADPVDAWLQALLKQVHGKGSRGGGRKVARDGSALAEELRKGTISADDLALKPDEAMDMPRRASSCGRADAADVEFTALNGLWP
jgi:hypothetical protein